MVYSEDELLTQMKPYIAVHIRRGDKVAGRIKEAEATEVSEYIAKVKNINSGITNIFVATDDFMVVEEFQSRCPSEWHVFSLSSPERQGYDLLKFNTESGSRRKREMVELFVDMHFLSKAEAFVGTYSSNMGRLVALLRGGYRCHSMDIDWHPR